MISMWLTVHLKEEKEEKNQRDRLRDYSQSVFFLQKNDGLLTRSSWLFADSLCQRVSASRWMQ